MQASTSPHEAGGHATRRGHATHLSISDPSHHVTEAIGHMYDDDYDRNDPRRLSYITTPLGESITTIPRAAAGSESPLSPSSPLHQSTSDGQPTQTNGNQRPPLVTNRSYDRESDPGNADGTRLPSDTATSSFPLNDIDYESNPAAVAQELNNLAAIRRMSMDVAAAGDPDLPGFAPPPSPSADEDDASRLFWVPARLHPELAPKEFKSFLDSKADLIKRRSGDSSTLGAERQGSGGGLNRKRSMLSRQIDNSAGYTDGADRLEHQRSQSNKQGGMLSPNLQQLESLVDDSQVVAKESLLRGMRNIAIAGNEDRPILPPAPPGNSLRRSTRTQYKKGSLKKGEKLPYSKRVGRGVSESAGSDTRSPGVRSPQDPASLELTGVSTGSNPKTTRAARATSASSHGSAYAPSSTTSSQFDSIVDQPEAEQEALSTSGGHPDADLDRSDSGDPTNTRKWHSRISSNGRSTLNIAPGEQKIPAIIETPPATEPDRIPSPPSQSRQSSDHATASTTPSPSKSTSSQDPIPKRPKNPRLPPHEPASSLNDIANNPQMIPGNSTRTDSLSFIPTISEERKPDERKPEERKPEERKSESKKSKDKKESDGSRKSSWHWLLGSEEKDKKKDKDADSKKTKSKTVDKTHDNTRLDVLQSSIESTPRGRESVVLDRLDPKVDEDRRKDNVRRVSGESKKEKDGIFSSIFGGGRKKHSNEGHHRKHSSRNISPDPPMRVLRADVDYPWSRFSILEERAIYRMAHIKLANPRRALYSQVLLSNFMYSYLAKVQQMHPQMPVVSSGSSQRSSKSRDQPDEYAQYQRYQESQDQQHYGESAYDDSSMYDYDDDSHDRYGSHSRSDKQGYENGQAYGPGHQYGNTSFGDDVQLDDDDDDDMW
ncbi:hypothetical protein CBS147332_3119 [Penicillium roqueforti]|nr:hypothetical protein CBS147372_1501 [Penicillium roqueforti]KAI2726232.1 hypothetical protein CBS147332_3119 [Penicillium roqueforti]KAI3125536.1 hypothetical protein CBS147331_530 [Penicillium roqueforti]KAI3166207.1 hypothetical protein CBS147317_2150 [Penicillium roqueforti]